MHACVHAIGSLVFGFLVVLASCLCLPVCCSQQTDYVDMANVVERRRSSGVRNAVAESSFTSSTPSAVTAARGARSTQSTRSEVRFVGSKGQVNARWRGGGCPVVFLQFIRNSSVLC